MALVSVRRSLNKLQLFRKTAQDRVRASVLSYNKEGKEGKEVDARLERLTGSFSITPVSLDPAGIIGKLEHVLDTYDNHLKEEVRTLATSASEAEINTLTNQVEISIGLDTMYRVVRHYYLLARKQGGILALAQLQMTLPTIMEEAEAYKAAIESFAQGKPVGDGIGPSVASRLAAGVEGKELVKDTIVYEVPWEGRNVLVVRAKGPGGNVGKPGLVVEKLIQDSGPINLVVTVDAALKLEGESSGDIAEGIGVALGGPGTERYHIEASAVKHGIPLVAVVVKMSSKEAISTMTARLNDAVGEAAKRVQNVIVAQTKPGERVIVAGVGNTIGIA